MLDIKYIRENSEIVKKAAIDKLINVDIDRLLELDTSIRKLNQELDAIKEVLKNNIESTFKTFS